jgi:hypothetical protein
MTVGMIVSDTARAVDVAQVAIRVESRGGAPIRTLNISDGGTLIEWTAEWLLRVVARLLPAAGRARFVAEAVGDLGMCESRRERIGYLVGVVAGLPGLAWVMRRESRRRPAS